MQLLRNVGLYLILVILIVACIPSAVDPSGESVDSGSMTSAVPLNQSSANNGPTKLPPPIIETKPAPTVSTNTLPEVEPSSEANSEATQRENGPIQSNAVYRVAFVEEDDTLNVREGPGVEYEILGEFVPGEHGLIKTESAYSSSNDLWFRVNDSDLDGWVNSRYLVEMDPSSNFCDSSDITNLLEGLILAMSTQDPEIMATLVSESRGIAFRRHWWNPEVYYAHEDLANIFDDTDSRFWGTADGSGDEIAGTFSDVLGPIIATNLLNATESACNQIIHGGTAGLVVLPDSYAGINYVSLYREPAPEEFELDWGTWVIGIESWEGQYYLSYMVHYEWEI